MKIDGRPDVSYIIPVCQKCQQDWIYIRGLTCDTVMCSPSYTHLLLLETQAKGGWGRNAASLKPSLQNQRRPETSGAKAETGKGQDFRMMKTEILPFQDVHYCTGYSQQCLLSVWALVQPWKRTFIMCRKGLMELDRAPSEG